MAVHSGPHWLAASSVLLHSGLAPSPQHDDIAKDAAHSCAQQAQVTCSRGGSHASAGAVYVIEMHGVQMPVSVPPCTGKEACWLLHRDLCSCLAGRTFVEGLLHLLRHYHLQAIVSCDCVNPKDSSHARAYTAVESSCPFHKSMLPWTDQCQVK